MMLEREHLDDKLFGMRTTITFDPDVARAVEKIRRERGAGVSRVVNELIRNGLRHPAGGRRFRQRSKAIGLQIDVTDVAEALDLLEGPAGR